jgi:hypothetical protein
MTIEDKKSKVKSVSDVIIKSDLMVADLVKPQFVVFHEGA